MKFTYFWLFPKPIVLENERFFWIFLFLVKWNSHAFRWFPCHYWSKWAIVKVRASRIVGLAITTRCIAVGTDNAARSCGHVVAPLSVVVYSRRRLYWYFHQPLDLCFILGYNGIHIFFIFSKAYFLAKPIGYRLWQFTNLSEIGRSRYFHQPLYLRFILGYYEIHLFLTFSKAYCLRKLTIFWNFFVFSKMKFTCL